MHRNSISGLYGGPSSATVEGLSPDELYLAGTQYFKLRDYLSARACFERHLEINPEDASAWHLLARVFLHLNHDLDKAELCIKKSIELDRSTETRCIETLGVIYIHRGRYADAEDVLAYALTKDPGDDPRHTASLEYHLGLAKKKNRRKPAGRHGQAGVPQFLTEDIGRWREHRRQSLFILPSFLVHAIALFVVFYLSTHDLPFKKEFKEDFTYVDVEQEQVAQTAETGGSVSGEAGEAGGQQEMPAPVSERKAVEPGELQKGASAPGRVEMPDKTSDAARDALGRKAGAELEPARAGEKALMARATQDKTLDLKVRQQAAVEGDVNLVRKSLGEVSASGDTASAREAAMGTVAGRTETAASTDGIYIGPGRQDKQNKWEREKLASLKEDTRREEARAIRQSERALSVDTPAMKDRFRNDIKDIPARPLSIGAGGPVSQARTDNTAERPRSMDRQAQSGASVTADMSRPNAAAPSKGISTAKTMSAIPGQARDLASPQFDNQDSERRVDLPESMGRKMLASNETIPVRKALGLTASGGSASAAQGPGRASRESFSSPDRGSAGSASPAFNPASPSGGALGGSKAVVGSAKAADPRALGKDADDVSGEAGGFLSRAASKVTGMLGLGGGQGRGAAPDARPRKAGDLSGLAPKAGGGGAGTGTAAGVRRQPAVRIGDSEKSRVVPAAAADAGRTPDATEGARSAAGGKKMAEGLLGVPGGSGAERYASAARGETKPVTTEKQSGVARGSRVVAKNSVGPIVAITSPSSGGTRQLSQVIKGTVSDPRARKAQLTINNDTRIISVDRGSFESVVSIHKGRNIITVTAFDTEGNAGKDSITLDYSEPTEGAPVNIISPRDGQVFDVTERSVVRVKGTIGDQDIKRAKLILNDRPMDIVVNRGYFEQDVALGQEKNSILVEATDRYGQVSRSQTLSVGTVNVKPKDIMIILSWDKPHADMDLHVFGPSGGHTYYKSPSMYESSDAIPGGQLEQDSKGNFGPEVYTQEKADKGTYTVKSNYFYSGGDGDCNATATVILYGGNPSRRIVRVFGPHLQVDTKNGEDTWGIAKFKMPEGIFLED